MVCNELDMCGHLSTTLGLLVFLGLQAYSLARGGMAIAFQRVRCTLAFEKVVLIYKSCRKLMIVKGNIDILKRIVRRQINM